MAFIRVNRSKTKYRCQLLRAALGNARRYLREFEALKTLFTEPEFVFLSHGTH
jgi:hypothetical protein